MGTSRLSEARGLARVFEGLRVVEFAQGMAGPMAAMIMADNGAEVIKVEPRGGDWKRTSPGFLMWNRGKKSVCLDLEDAAGRAQARELALTADVVLSTFAPGEAERYGLDAASLNKERPDLVVCTLTGFGRAARHEQLAARHEIVVAKSGRANNNLGMAGAHRHTLGDPVFLGPPYGMLGAAGLALQGITAALLARERTGYGQKVETSLLDGLVATSMRFPFKRQGDKVVSGVKERWETPLMRGVQMCFMTPTCKDGRYIQMCARQDHHFRNWLKAMGIEHVLQEERYKGAPLGIKNTRDIDELEALIAARMATRTQPEWMHIFSTELDVGSDPFLTFEEFLEHPQMVENGRVAELDDARFGKVKQVGPLALFSETPSSITRSAPALGEHQAELAELLRHKPRIPASNAREALAKPPLSGVTILDLASYLATPLGATWLAELGARVIKVEPLEGDSFRRTGLESIHLMHGKESLAVDLKSPGGKAIFERLVKGADAVLHNMRPGVPERLGVDYESLRKLNPSLIYLYGASYGSKGPQKHRPAFHSTPHALCGAGILQGGEGNPPVDDSYPDPVSAVGVAMSLAMGLYARERSGRGQYIETTMLTTTGYVCSEYLVHYAGAPKAPVMDHKQLGLGPRNRLYKTKDGWLMLSAVLPQESQALARALGLGEIKEGDAGLAALLEQRFAAKDTLAWEQELNAAGVPCAATSPSYEEFMVENKMVEPEDHAVYGTYWRQKPRIRFSVSAARLGLPCAIGEHTKALLAELGYSPAEIEKFVAQSVVGVPKPAPAAAKVTA